MGIRAAEQLLQPAGDRHEPGLGDHQLAGQVHQVVEPVAVDADRLGDPAPCRCRFWALAPPGGPLSWRGLRAPAPAPVLRDALWCQGDVVGPG